MKHFIFTAVLFMAFIAGRAREEGSSTPSNLKSVTVYRSGAEMVHTASAALKQGDNTLIIENLSNQLDVNSIQVKAPATVTVLGVEFSGNYLDIPEPSAREKMLNDSLVHVQDEQQKVDLSITNATDLLQVLKDNRNIKGEQTGLAVTELVKLMDYYKAKSLELQTDLQQLNIKRKKLSDVADRIKSQITEEQKKNVKTSGRLTLRLSAAVDGKYDFVISYVAQNAYWTPYYDVRVDNINSPLKLSYKAKIVQTTGIDWKQVKLSLSTSTPAQNNNAPSISTWFLGYINPVAGLNIRMQESSSQLNEVVVVGYSAQKRDDIVEEDNDKVVKRVYVVNGSIMSEESFHTINPNTIKSMRTLKGGEASALYGAQAAGGATVVELKSGLEDYVSVADSMMNVVFEIDIPFNVPTNGKEQVATLRVLDVNATYKHFAVPKFDNSAYLLSEITGFEKLNLLPGEANIIFENTYIGKSFINPASTNDTLNLTMGRDERVSIKREKVTDFSSVKFLGSNKQQKFAFEITVKNNKAEAINILLKDQIPVSTNKDIEVTAIDNGGAELDNNTGILNWKLSLAPGESKKVQFIYSIKYPKDKTLNIN